MEDKIKEISLKDLLDTKFTINDKNEMVGTFTLDRINMIAGILTNLYKENETLRKNQRYYKNGVFSLEYDKETLSDMIDDYKSRNEKAIEYINKLSNEPNAFGHYGIDGNCKKYLLNILKGDKDEYKI